MRVSFFNYLPLEYGGGLAEYYMRTAKNLSKETPQHTYLIVTFDEQFARRISRFYSFYFLSKRHTQPIIQDKKSIQASLPRIQYKQVANFKELAATLLASDVIYTKNDFVELLLLKIVGIKKATSIVIIGYHTPVFYEKTSTFQAKIHNLLYASRLYISLLALATHHHTLNRYDTDWLHKRITTKITQIYNAFDFRTFTKKAATPQLFKRISGKKTILWVGRLTEQKGVSELCTIITRINSTTDRNRVQWVIVGVGELHDEIAALQKRWSNVIYLGYVDQARIARVYKDSDVFIATPSWESLPYTFLEAISFSLPIISYRIHGVLELIPSKQAGFLVSTTDEFVDTIRLLLHKEKPMKTVRSTSFLKQFAEEKSTESFVSSFLKPYE